ncbi:MAG: glutamate ligase domain-containing protein, partial [Paludibacteraceae bacterium]
YGHIHIVFGMVSDKDVDAVLSLLPLNAIYYFTQAATHRAIPAEHLLEMAKKHHLAGKAFKSVKEAVDSARNSLSVNDFLYIGGSNYIVGEALPLF